MADPRIRTIDTSRLPVPQAGLNGMRVSAASQSEQMGGQNYSGSISRELAEIGAAISTSGKLISTGADLAGLGRTLDYQQTAQQNQQNMQGAADKLGIGAMKFENDRVNFLDSASTFSGLQSIASTYQQRGEEIVTQANTLTQRNDQIKRDSDALMAQLRTTRDRTQQTEIRNQLTALRDEALGNSTTLGNLKAESTLLNTSLSQTVTEMERAGAQAQADRDTLLRSEAQLRRDVGEFGQTAQNAMNDQQSFVNFMNGVNYGKMSGGALGTIGNGMADIAMQNYAAGSLGIGAASFDFSSVLAPQVAPYASILKAATIGIGYGIDTGNLLAGLNRASELLGTAAHLDGMMRASAAFDRAFAAGDFKGMLAASFGATGNTLNFSAEIMRNLGAIPEARGIATALSIGGATAQLTGAGYLNLLSQNAEAEVQAALAMTNIFMMTSTASGGMVDLLYAAWQSANNLLSGRELGDPNNPSWEETLIDVIRDQIREQGGGVEIDPFASYMNGLGKQVVVKDVDYNLFNPAPQQYTGLYDGPSMPMSFPWSDAPVNPYDPFTGDPNKTPPETFQPVWKTPWNPADPFRLNPTRPNLPDTNPSCPKEPPKSGARGTGNPDGLPIGWRSG